MPCSCRSLPSEPQPSPTTPHVAFCWVQVAGATTPPPHWLTSSPADGGCGTDPAVEDAATAVAHGAAAGVGGSTGQRGARRAATALVGGPASAADFSSWAGATNERSSAAVADDAAAGAGDGAGGGHAHPAVQVAAEEAAAAGDPASAANFRQGTGAAVHQVAAAICHGAALHAQLRAVGGDTAGPAARAGDAAAATGLGQTAGEQSRRALAVADGAAVAPAAHVSCAALPSALPPPRPPSRPLSAPDPALPITSTGAPTRAPTRASTVATRGRPDAVTARDQHTQHEHGASDRIPHRDDSQPERI